MERRTALATAGAITATVMTAAIALGANMGLFGLASADEGPGHLRLVDTPSSKLAHTEVVDVPVPVSVPASGTPASGSGGAPAGQGSSYAPGAGSSGGDDSYDEPDDEVHEPEDDAGGEVEDDD